MPQAIAVIGAIGGIAGTAIQYRQGRKAAKAQQSQQELSSRRERMQAIRQSQMQRASAMMSAVGAGSSDSSGAAGGIGSMSSQLGTELSYGAQMTDLSRQIGAAQTKSSFGAGLAGLGMTGFQLAGGFDALGFGQGSSGPNFQPLPDNNPNRPRPNPYY